MLLRFARSAFRREAISFHGGEMLTTNIAWNHALKTLRDDADGATLVENALVIALVAIATIGALTILGIDIRNAFLTIGAWITAAVGAASGGGGVSPGPGP